MSAPSDKYLLAPAFWPADSEQELRPADSGIAELYQRYRTELCRYIAKTFGRGPPDPEDVVHSAFAQYAALADPAAITNPRAFLYRTAHNVAVQQLRREATRVRHDGETWHAYFAPAADELDGERVLLQKERYRIIEATIRAMEPVRRELLVMNRIHELSFAEIARRTGISQTQVKRLVADAVLECNEALKRASQP